MSTRRFRAAVPAVALAALLPSVLAAQHAGPTSSETVPRALLVAAMQSGATAFMSNGAGPDVSVGSIPAGFAADLYLPTGARVIGAVYDAANMYAFVHVSGEPDALRAQMDSALLARGWRHPPPPDYPGGGFRFYPMPPHSPPGSQPYCRGLLMLTMSVNGSAEAPANLVLRETTEARASTCRPPGKISHLSPPSRTATLPRLFNPPSAGYAGYPRACMNTYGSGSSTALGAAVAPDSALDFYGRQLADSGWTPASSPTVFGRSWTKPDSAGNPAEVSIVVVRRAIGAPCLDIQMQERVQRR